MNNELAYFGHIRITIQSDFTCDNGKQAYNDAETVLFTTFDNNEIKSIALQDENYHNRVLKILENTIEAYKIKYNIKGR